MAVRPLFRRRPRGQSRSLLNPHAPATAPAPGAPRAVEHHGELVARPARGGADGRQQRRASGREALALASAKIRVAADDVVAIHEPSHEPTGGGLTSPPDATATATTAARRSDR